MNKPLLLAAAILCVNALQAQVYKADTAFTSHKGAGTANASCVLGKSGSTYLVNYGFNQNRALYFMMAEDFVVPTGQTWNLDTVIVYGYQTNSPTTSSITECQLMIYQGSLTGPVVFGDSATNRMVSSSWTGIYRVDTTASSGGLTSTARPIMQMKMKLTPTKTLTAGTYWMAWGAKGSSSFTGPWCPQKVNPNGTRPTGQNGMQRTAGVWKPSLDSLSATSAVNMGFGFILKGPQKPTGVFSASSNANFLTQNQPNPFSGSTTISFDLAEAGHVKLEVYNSVGQHISTLVDEHLPAGKKEIVFNASGLAAGRYFYMLRTEAGTQMKPMEILK